MDFESDGKLGGDEMPFHTYLCEFSRNGYEYG